MKKLKYGILASVLVLLVGAVLVWRCFRGSGDAIASSLPRNLAMVGRVDLKRFVVENGLSKDDAVAVMNKWLRYTPEVESGIDYFSPSYVFASQGYLGSIIPLTDAEDFEKFLKETTNCVVESQRGIRWAVVTGDVLVAIAEDRAIAIGPAVGAEQDNLRNVLVTCLKQSEDESGKQSRLYELLENRTEPVAMAMSLDVIPGDLRPGLLKNLPEDIELSELELTAGLTVEKDRVSLLLAVGSENKKVNAMLDKVNDVTRPIDASLLKTAPSHPAFHLEMGLRGEKLLQLLRENPELRTQLLAANTIFDLDMIVKSIEGDVAVSAKHIGINSLDFLFQAQLQDERFMKNVATWNDELTRLAGVRFTASSDNRGTVEFDGHTYHFGTEGHRLFVSNAASLADVTAHYDLAYTWADEMKGNVLYARLDFSELRNLFYFIPGARSLAVFDHLAVSAAGVRECKVELVASEHTDLLQLIRDKWKQ